MLNSHFFPKNYNPTLIIRPQSRINSYESEVLNRKGKLVKHSEMLKPKQYKSLENNAKRSRSMTIPTSSRPQINKRHVVVNGNTEPIKNKAKSNNFIARKRQRSLVVKGFRKQPMLDISLQKLTNSPRKIISMNSYRFRNLRNKKQDLEEMNIKNKTAQLFMVKKYSKEMQVNGWDYQDDQYTTDLF